MVTEEKTLPIVHWRTNQITKQGNQQAWCGEWFERSDDQVWADTAQAGNGSALCGGCLDKATKVGE